MPENTPLLHRFVSADESRGQLILITAISLAAILVGLVFILNTALVTENVETEPVSESTYDAKTAQSSITHVYSDTLYEINTNTSTTTGSGVEDSILQASEDKNDQITRQYLNIRSSTLSLGDVESSNVVMGDVVRDSSRGTYESANTTTGRFKTWNPVDAQRSEVRDGQMTFDAESLHEAGGSTDFSGQTTIDGNEVDGAFQVVSTKQTDSVAWYLFMFQDNNDLVVATAVGTANITAQPDPGNVSANFNHGDVTVRYRQSFDKLDRNSDGQINATVDFADGTVMGKPAFRYADGGGLGSNQQIIFRNGDQIDGIWRLVTTGDPQPFVLDSSEQSPDPYTYSGVYSVTVPYQYHSGEYDLGGSVTITPDKPNADENPRDVFFEPVAIPEPDLEAET